MFSLLGNSERSHRDLEIQASASPPKKQKVLRGTTHDERVRFWTLFAIGTVLILGGYFWLTSARILGKSFELDYGPESPVFAQSMGPLLGAEFVDGNTVKTFVNGDAFFPEMLKAIAGAKKTITFETYIWEPGKVSDRFVAALKERARAGVRVHVLVDGMGTLKLPRETADDLKSAGVEFLKYGREHWYVLKPNINHRTHRKILVIDGTVGFTGGMCISDTWEGNANSPKVWRETVVRVEGPAVRQLQSVFASNWLKTTSRLLVGPDYFPRTGSSGPSVAQCMKSGPDDMPENARVSHLLAIASARHSIRIEHAYFVPDDLAVDMLLAAVKRGVKIEVIVPAINDSRFGRAASRSRWGKLLAAGVKFYEFQPSMLHCKSVIVDDILLTVGSANFDNRSFAINDEVELNVLDRAVAAEHVRIFEADRERSTPLTREEFEGRPRWQKWIDGFCGMFRSQL